MTQINNSYSLDNADQTGLDGTNINRASAHNKTENSTMSTTQPKPTSKKPVRKSTSGATKTKSEDATGKDAHDGTVEVAGTALPVHRFGTLLPPADEQTLAGMEADMRKHGQREAITTYKGEMVDGCNRASLCKKIGIEPRYEEFKGSEAELLQFVLAKNVYRRHLTTSQRAIIGAKMSEKSKSDENPQICGLFKQPEAAKAMNVSLRQVEDAARLLREGSPELIAKVERGEETIHAALKEIKPAKPKADKAPAEQSESKSEKSKADKPANQEDAAPASSAPTKGESTPEQTPEASSAPIDPVLAKAQEVLSPTPENNELLLDAYADIVIEMYDNGLTDVDLREEFRQWLKTGIVEYVDGNALAVIRGVLDSVDSILELFGAASESETQQAVKELQDVAYDKFSSVASALRKLGADYPQTSEASDQVA